MVRPSPAVLDVLGTIVRIGLGAVWLISGAIKFADSGQTYVAVQAYDVLPAPWVSPVAMVLPLVELGLGVLLLAGLFTRWTAVASAVLLLAFIAGLSQAWARGLSIDCGCFGGGGPVDHGATAYPLELAVDVGFLALAVWLIVRPRTRWAVSKQEESGHGWSRAQGASTPAGGGAAAGGAGVGEDLVEGHGEGVEELEPGRVGDG